MAIEELLAQNLEVNKQILSALSQQGYDRALQLGQLAPFDVRSFDITSAITAQRVIFPPCRYIQATVDGQSLEGITVRLGTQSAPEIPLAQVDVLAVGSATELYLNSDVRSGRSRLTLYFVRIEPLKLHLGGDISLAENAARLGSINTFDRRGEVLWADDFESGLKWRTAMLGTGASVEISSAQASSGRLSCLLKTGSANNDYAYLFRHLLYPNLSKIGFEIKSTLAAEEAAYNLDIYIDTYTGTNYLNYVIRWTYAGGLLQYLNASNVFTTFASGISTRYFENFFLPLKLVVDLNTQRYVRFIFGRNSYDLSQYAGYSTASALSPILSVRAYLTTTAGAQKSAYIDDAIITTNEP